MKRFDRLLQSWRISKALDFIPHDARVIDVGAHHGELFQKMGSRLKEGFGIDPLAKSTISKPSFTICQGYFPEVIPPSTDWDVIAMLAVLEHIPPFSYADLVHACHRLLKPGGRIIITVPSTQVDLILSFFVFFKLADGMSLEEHHGFNPDTTLRIFQSPNFKLIHSQRFQLGLNNLFVFERESNFS